jgi:hypothetical protein
MPAITIRRGERGRNRFGFIEPGGSRSLKLGQEDAQLGFNELIVFDDNNAAIDFALDIIGKQPALSLAENARMLRLCKAVVASASE